MTSLAPSSSPTAAPASAPPKVALICAGMQPYRIHLHERLRQEIPQASFHTVLTHKENTWTQLQVPESLNPVWFDDGHLLTEAGQLRHQLREWRRADRIIRWLHAQDIRMVLCNGYADLCRVHLLRHCHQVGIPCYLWGDSNIRADLVDGFKRSLKHAILPRVLNWTTGILPCGAMGHAYFRRYGIAPERIHYFPLWPDPTLLTDLPPARIDEVRHRYDLAPQRKRLIYSGRLVPVKRVDQVIRAFAEIAPHRPEWDLVIAGDGPMRPYLHDMVPPTLESRVRWTGFLNDQADVSALYRTSDVLVLASTYEPWALVLIEAALAGLALISSDVVGAAADLLVDGVNGRKYPAGDLLALAQAMLEVTDPERLPAMKAASAQQAQTITRAHDPVATLRRLLREHDLI